MKLVFRSIPAFLALVVLGAHFYRAGLLPLVVLCLLALGLLFVRKAWATWTLRAMLVAGAFEWLRTAQRIAAFREQAGQPATRMWVILGSVAAFTALAAWVMPGASRGSRTPSA
ncbi:MAG TPA: hypothetical protein VF139_17655 [Candidatus Polarisedimenticolaceae bacterium]